MALGSDGKVRILEDAKMPDGKMMSHQIKKQDVP